MKKIFSAASALYLTLCQKTYAAVPTAPQPTNGASEDNMLEWLKGLLMDGIALIALILSATGFIWLGWIALSELNQARQGRKEWGEVGVSVVGGAIVFGFVTFLLSQAIGVF